MRKYCDMVLLVAVFLLLVIAIVFVAILVIQESPQDAYERGKIDGQILVYEKWNIKSRETVDLLTDCIHLVSLSEFGLLATDSTDTMPGGFDDIAGFDYRLDAEGNLVLVVEYAHPDSMDTMPAVDSAETFEARDE